jgi:formate dehydrogenase major subunit
MAAPGSGYVTTMASVFRRIPLLRQFIDDPTGRNEAARSAATESTSARTADADRVVQSICPYCAVGCGQRLFVTDGELVQVEGDPDSPISRGRLCPKGSATKQLLTDPGRPSTIKYRPKHGREWVDLDLDEAMDMIAERVVRSRRNGWQDTDDEGRRLHRTLGFASLGGAALDNEENYLIKKLFTALGAIQIENQARI